MEDHALELAAKIKGDELHGFDQRFGLKELIGRDEGQGRDALRVAHPDGQAKGLDSASFRESEFLRDPRLWHFSRSSTYSSIA